MMTAAVCAVLLSTLVTAAGAVASDEMFELSEAPDFTRVVLITVDNHGDPYGTAGPWTFHFDRRHEPAQSSWIRASMASTIAAYMRAHPRAQLRIDGAGAWTKGSGGRDRRINTILASLIAAGVPVDTLRFGPR